MNDTMKQTPLNAVHKALGARMVPFGGWEMPVQYTSIVDEHLAVRQAAGLFDISHMGEVTVSGSGAVAFLNRVLTNDIRKLSPGQGQYTLMCNERGGVVDDLTGETVSAVLDKVTRLRLGNARRPGERERGGGSVQGGRAVGLSVTARAGTDLARRVIHVRPFALDFPEVLVQGLKKNAAVGGHEKVG